MNTMTDEAIVESLKFIAIKNSWGDAFVARVLTNAVHLIQRLQDENRDKTNRLYELCNKDHDNLMKIREQKEKIERLSGPIGKFKDQSALLKAYESLEKEFTKRSQRLKELQKNNDDLVEDLANMTIYPEEAVKRIMAQTEKCTAKEILILAEDYNCGYESNMDDFMLALKERYGVEVE
jgi:chromosome segregation ATPase